MFNLRLAIVCVSLFVCLASTSADERPKEASTETAKPLVMDKADALNWTMVFAVTIAAAHIVSPKMRQVIESHEHQFGSFGGGMAAGYVFVHLFPELDAGHDFIGDRIDGVVLIGLLMYYGAEVYLARKRLKHPETEGKHGFGIEISLGWVYTWLILYSLPDELTENGLTLVPGLIAVILHLVFSDSHLGKSYPKRFDGYGRFVLASAALAGWATDLFYFEDDPLISDVLTALLAGSVVYKLFKHEMPDGNKSSFGWFLVGTVSFTALDLLARGF